MSDWEIRKEEGYFDIYYKVKLFNGTKYKIEICPHLESKSISLFVGITSGNKRKEIDSYKEEGVIRSGGIKALIWVKKEMLKFPEYYRKLNKQILKTYICVGWSDTRRRDIYEHALLKEGFNYAMSYGKKVLRKEIL